MMSVLSKMLENLNVYPNIYSPERSFFFKRNSTVNKTDQLQTKQKNEIYFSTIDILSKAGTLTK